MLSNTLLGLGLMNSRLVTEVIRGLNAARGDWARISEETGVSYSSISKLVCGETVKPGTPMIEQIYLALVRRGHCKSRFEFRDCA